ncbi:MAG: valine--tRNA ligase [Erysipelotrichaceae bacterium]|nr:valine--tRNA ligase [Erysipelotrichaceae bacterium]
MGKTYDPKAFEDKIYEAWMSQGHFKANVNPDKKPYTIVLPPPNITGQLHMGHALDQTLQDILIRWRRMQGFEALWLPGTDHASIATEVKVVEKIRKEEGLGKEDIGREGFLERAWAWRKDYGRQIVNQMMKLGSSCDWSRERFTMDEGCNKAVTEVFIRLYEKGYIYRGNRLINWCPDCMTTLSDAEVEHEEKQGAFYHIKYFLKGSEDEYLEIATTRPETMLGDTGIAVHPEDPRYARYVGKIAILPLVGRELPIVADAYVDRELGTGALKVTPAHDPNDYEIGRRHNLETVEAMNFDGTMSEAAGEFKGLDRLVCRKAVVEKLKSSSHLKEVREMLHNVGTCYRCHTVIEPMLSDQWFVQMDELAVPAIEAVKNGSLDFVPERFTKIYLHWLDNIRDWCISRQLWWGHRIPAYYCKHCSKIVVSREMPEVCPDCGGTEFRQDEDVLDTWFSSALWPFSTLGWPDKTPDLEYFYPTNVLVTGYDIIFFWVVRMVFSGIDSMGEVPFDKVLIHGLVRAADGKKMSKSLGNGVDPLDVIDQYGADALRFMLATGNSPGNDLKFQLERVEASRNFANKLWNASRFVLMGLESDPGRLDGTETLTLADRWILSRLSDLTQEATDNLEKFELGVAANKIYEFVWNEYCDWYIETAKRRLYGEDPDAKRSVQRVLLHVLKDILKLLHPFMPYITEEIWQHLSDSNGDLIVAAWPAADLSRQDPESERAMEILMDAIRSIRNSRAEMDVAPSRKARLIVKVAPELQAVFLDQKAYLESLASASEVRAFVEGETIEDAVSVVVPGGELLMPLDDLIDYNKEAERLEREVKKWSGEIERIDAKLNNPGFVAKAPVQLVEEERTKRITLVEMLTTSGGRLDKVKAKLN